MSGNGLSLKPITYKPKTCDASRRPDKSPFFSPSLLPCGGRAGGGAKKTENIKKVLAKALKKEYNTTQIESIGILLLSCGVLVLCDGAPRTMSGGEPSSIKRSARATQSACTPCDRGKILLKIKVEMILAIKSKTRNVFPNFNFQLLSFNFQNNSLPTERNVPPCTASSTANGGRRCSPT